MSIQPMPTPLQHLGGRRFSFYPPIRNLEPNEWLFQKATWYECVVVNAESGFEICIPRIFLGEVAAIDEPRRGELEMIVGLHRELEYKNGGIRPRQRKVIELPVVVHDERPASAGARLRAAVVNIRLEQKAPTRARKWIGVAAVLGAVALTIVADVARQSQLHQRADLFRGSRSYLQLTPGDDYDAVVLKLGVPARSDVTMSGERVFRKMWYPSRRFSAVLMGASRDGARYIGAIDPRGRVLDTVRLPDGSNAAELLHSLGSPAL